ncbi:hypothetical protein AWENTII_005176 [Aspergillus wentii]
MVNQNFITADQIERAVDKAYLTTPITSLDQIVDESALALRNEIHEIPPANTPEGDDNSESESEGLILSGGNKLNKTVIGGALVRNVSLVVPVGDASFADLPVVPIKGSNNVNAQLLAAAADDKSPGKSNQLAVLLLPDEGNLVPVAQPLASEPPADATMLSSLITTTSDIKEGGSLTKEKKILKQKLETYVLSGTIDKFFGIKGLTAKLYKFQESEAGDHSKKDDASTKKVDGDADDKKKDDSSEPPSVPAHEMAILNPESGALEGKPLGTLFPFINDKDLQKMPIKNLAFTYCEESESPFIKPGLCLEADVMLKDSLQWAADTLKKMFGDQKTPDSIRLSAHLSKERDWSKMPVVKEFILQGYFHDMGLKTWDVLQFKTMGIEITGTKAAKGKHSGDTKEKNDKDEDSSKPSDDPNKERPKNSTKDEETKPIAEPEDDSEKPDKEKHKEENANGEEESKKTKEPQSWNFGFGFYGTVMLTNVPHANVPLELNYRIARDFEVEGNSDGEDNKGEDKKDEDKSKEKTEESAANLTKPDNEGIKDGSKSTMTKLPEGEKPKKEYSDGAHKRIWNMVIWCDKWEDIYGIKNVSLTKAELKFSFEQGTFRETVQLNLTADLTLGSGTFSAVGKFSKNENSLDAKIGDLTLSEIKKIHAQIAGYALPADNAATEAEVKKEAKGNEITFKNLHLNLSSTKMGGSTDRSLQLDGCVGFNEHSSASALVKIDQDGLSISGDIKDFDIPDTHIKIEKAGLHIYIGFKQGTKSEKAVDGEENKNFKAVTDGKETKSNKKESKGETLTKTDDEEEKPVGTKRASEFAIMGIVKIESFTVTVGFHIEQKPDKPTRDWILVGSVASIKLDQLWSDLKGGFLDLELDRVALIASSEEREKQDPTESSAVDSWDVLAQVDAYGYPVVKGIQLCASIRKFDVLDEMNDKKKMEDLVLIVAFPSQGKLKFSIDMPESFQVPISKCLKLCKFGATIGADDTGPYLQLNTTLTLSYKGQSPINVIGDIRGSMTDAYGALYMKEGDKWVDPFGLNKKAVVSELGVGAGFKYATVLEEGPDQFSFAGKLDLGDKFHGKMVLHFGVGEEQVIIVKASEINVVQLIRLAGELADIKELANIEGGDDILVFRDLELYLSTGAEVFGITYERGIHVNGKMEFLKKTGDFKGSLTDDGVTVKAGVDQFSIGGLKVTSASAGGKRATLDVEMTKEKQKISVDGMIQYYDIHAKMLVDADIQERRLNANIDIQFIESLSFLLKAKVQVPQGSSTDDLKADFDAQLTPDVYGAIFDGIHHGIDALGKLVTQEIDNAKKDIQRQIDEHGQELKKMEQELNQMKIESAKQVKIREQKIKQNDDQLTELRNELDHLEGDVKSAEAQKNKNDAKVASTKAERDAAKRKLDKKIRDMTAEYNRQLTEQEDQQQKWQAKKQSLENQKNATWGDDLRKGAAAQANLEYWNAQVKEAQGEVKHWKTVIANSGPFGKLGGLASLSVALGKLGSDEAQRAIYSGLINVMQDILSSPEFEGVEKDITEAVEKIKNIGAGIDALKSQGVYGFIQAMSRDEKAELNRQIQLLNDLEAEGQKLEDELIKARNKLEKNRGRITADQIAAQRSIAQLQAEIKLKPFESDLRAKQVEFANIKAKINTLQRTLDDVDKGVDKTTHVSEEIVGALKKGVPRVTMIDVQANTDVFIENKPLVFTLYVDWLGKQNKHEVDWAPGVDAADLYKRAADMIIKGH